MTRAGSVQSPASPKASLFPSSQPSLSTESKIPRQYVRVPKDQEALLNRADAWSTSGFANVPNEVLQNLQDFHSRESQVPPRSKSSDRSSDRSSASPPGRAAVPSRSGVQQQAELEDQDSDDSESGTSWSTSPVRGVGGSRVASEAREPSSPPGRHPSPSPALPRPVPKAISRTSFLNSFPSSSLGSDGEMEVDPPRAITDVADPVKRTMQVLQPEPTPPSAQAQIVPCTYNDHSSPMKPPEPPVRQPNRRRPMKAIKFDSPQSGQDAPPPPQPAAVELARPPILPPTRTSGLTSSSSNLVTSSLDAYQISRSAPSLSKRRYSMIESSHGETSSYDQGTGQNGSSNTEVLPPNGPASQVPFTAFTVQYPEYTGSLGDFVKAIICIQDLQQNRALPEFLYDDFIRVFSEDYLDYIGKLEETAKPLTTSQWYNEHVHQPVFTKGVITRSALKDVVESYPDEFRSARRSLGSNRRSQEPPLPKASDPRTEVTSIPTDTQNELPRAMGALEDIGGELGSDPIQSTDVPWPSNISPGLPKRQGEVAEPILHRVDQSPEVRYPERTQDQSQRPEPHHTFGNDIWPAIRSQVALEIGHGTDVSTPSRQVRSNPATATVMEYTRSDSIPETAIKPKVPPRRSLGATARPYPSQKFINSKGGSDEDPASRSARFTKFLKKRQKRLQSSAPTSSIAD